MNATDPTVHQWPQGHEFGGSTITRELSGGQKGFGTHMVKTEWYGFFDRIDDGRWSFEYLAGKDGMKTGLYGVGDTPREAFESLVSRWTMTNGGLPSKAMQVIIPDLRAELERKGF